MDESSQKRVEKMLPLGTVTKQFQKAEKSAQNTNNSSNFLPQTLPTHTPTNHSANTFADQQPNLATN